MKFDKRAYYEQIAHWHRWFAWYPVVVGDYQRVWLEYVERRMRLPPDAHGGIIWEYREAV